MVATFGAQEAFGALLRRHRQAAALSQEQLAERAGLSVDAVSTLERGRRTQPRPDTVVLLVRVLGLEGEARAAFTAAARLHVPSLTMAAPGTPAASAVEPETPPLQLAIAPLPVALTGFVGRAREVGAVRARLLEPQTRLLTLTGPGGIGKTRMALEVARAVEGDFADGVAFVTLAEVSDPDLVTWAIARALGLHEQTGQPLPNLLRAALRDTRLLLLLDNCEQVSAAGPQLAELLAAAPGLRIVATSRARLAVAGERLYPVPPLGLPTPEQIADPAALGESEAVRLFVERARDALPAFTLDANNATTVGAICARLDGLPLAIELAASHVRHLPPRALLKQLEGSLALLTGGPRDAPERQRTLRATISWSYALLDHEGRALFRRLSVFAGGWTLQAAHAVCAPPEGLPAGDMLLGLAGLADQSLVVVESGPEDEPRYRLLETVHQYAAEQLAGTGEEAAVRQAHACWCVALAEEAEPRLTGPEQGVWLDRLEVEHDNLRAALDWTRVRGDGELGLRLAGALSRFWLRRGYLGEGWRLLEAALACGEGGSAAARAKALTGCGNLARVQGDYGRAVALHEESLAIERELGDTKGIAHVLGSLGDLARVQGDLRRASALLQEQLSLAREGGDKWSIANPLAYLGELARDQGDIAQAWSLYEEALTLGRELGNKSGIAWSLGGLGDLARDQGDYEQAGALLEEALGLRRELGEKRSIAHVLAFLGDVARLRGDYEQASAYLHEALTLAREVGDRWGTAYTLGNLGELARSRGEYGQARALLQEALGLRRELGNKSGIGWVLKDLGALAREQGDHEQAGTLLQEALTLAREAGDKRGMAHALSKLSEVSRDLGDVGQAWVRLHEALALRCELRNSWGIAWALRDLSDLARGQGDHEQARALLQEALALRPQPRHRADSARQPPNLEQFAVHREWSAVAHRQAAAQGPHEASVDGRAAQIKTEHAPAQRRTQ